MLLANEIFEGGRDRYSALSLLDDPVFRTKLGMRRLSQADKPAQGLLSV